MANDKLYAGRKAAGICVLCGKVPASEGHTMCAACAEHTQVHARDEGGIQSAGPVQPVRPAHGEGAAVRLAASEGVPEVQGEIQCVQGEEARM